MPNLTKPSAGSGKRGPHEEPPPTRVVIVRDDPSRLFRSVRPGDEASRTGVRVGFWTSIAVGFIAFLWMTGHVGESHGFARAVGVPELVTSNDSGLVAGVRMTLAAPLRVFEMAFADPIRLAIAFVLVALPAAGLAVSAPRVPGGPKPTKLAMTFAWLGLVAASVSWVLLVVWIVLPLRRSGLVSVPFERETFVTWSADLAATAGFDAFAFVASVCWLVLLYRLPLPRVAVVMAAIAGFIATFVTWTGFATSSGIADAISRERPIIGWPYGAPDDVGMSTSLVLGSIGDRVVVVTDGDVPLVMAEARPEFRISDRATLATWMRPRGNRWPLHTQ